MALPGVILPTLTTKKPRPLGSATIRLLPSDKANIILSGASASGLAWPSWMRRALTEYLVTGIKTTVPFHAAIMRSGEFREGKYDTGFVERMMSSEAFELKPPPVRLPAQARARQLDAASRRRTARRRPG